MIPVTAMWYLWFNPRYKAQRDLLLSTVMVSILAIAIGRGSALLLPFRERPLRDAALDINILASQSNLTLDGWSSFPSDHAVLYFFFAMAIFLISRKVGLLLFAHALIVISMFRILAGLHFPSDILAGAVIGIGMAMIFVRQTAKYVVPRLRLLDWEAVHPQSFYPVMFIVSFQIASMFESIRELLWLAKLFVT